MDPEVLNDLGHARDAAEIAVRRLTVCIANTSEFNTNRNQAMGDLARATEFMRRTYDHE